MANLIVSAEICEDVWSPVPPSIEAAREGATVIVNCSASDETIGKASYREALISGQSARLISGYIYANAGEGESTTDLVFGGHNLIAENGTILAEAKRFSNGIIYTEFDVQKIANERRKKYDIYRDTGTCTSEDSVWIRTDRNYSYKNISVQTIRSS